MEKRARGKHSSLFCRKKKKFYNIDTCAAMAASASMAAWRRFDKTFFFVTYYPNK
jgi:hypothetical protein